MTDVQTKPRRKRKRRKKRKPAARAEVVVRRGTAEDVPDITAMVAGANRSVLPAPFDVVDDEFLANMIGATVENGCVVVAVDGDALVGACVFVLAPLYYNPAHTMAMSFVRWVEPSARDRGVGGRLLAAAEARARDLGAHSFFSGVRASGAKVAQGLLAKGYRLTESYYSKGLTT